MSSFANLVILGAWKKSVDLISAIKIWDLMAQPDKIKEMLASQIQEEGLRTYLFVGAIWKPYES